MKIKYILTVMAIVAITQHSFAQFSEDVVRFSQSQYGSTARIKGIGNAQTAIGGDLSSISGNPAGIGFFTKSEASVTPEFNGTTQKALFFGQSGSAASNNLNFNNASVVFYSKLNTPAGTDKGKGWLSVNFGASYNRSADYYENISYKGTNANNSISNYYADLANVQPIDNGNSLQDFAFDHNLIDLYTGNVYKSNVFNSNGAPNKPVAQTENIIRDGGQTEFSFSVGANYSNQLYIGGGIGITSIRYDLSRTFTESGTAYIQPNSSNPAFNAAYTSNYSQVQATTGTGFNLRLGLIYKPVEEVRLGFLFTTPTWYTIQDDYSEGIQTNYPTYQNFTSGPEDYQTTYSFHSPLKVSGGLAVFLGKSGFITGDVEYIDYSSINLSEGDGYTPTADNHNIKTLYKSDANVHLVGKLKLD